MKDTKNLVSKAVIWATVIGITSLGIFIGIDLILWPGINNHSWFICPSLVLEFLVFGLMTVPKLNQKSKDFDQLCLAIRKIVVDNTKKDPLSPEPSLDFIIFRLGEIVGHGLEQERMAATLLAERTENERTTEKQFDDLEKTIHELIEPMMKVVVTVWNEGRGGTIKLTSLQSQNLCRELGRKILQALISVKATEYEIIHQFDDVKLLTDLIASAVGHGIVKVDSHLFREVSAIDLERRTTHPSSTRQNPTNPQDPTQASSDDTEPGITIDEAIETEQSPKIVGDNLRHPFHKAWTSVSEGYDKEPWNECLNQLDKAIAAAPEKAATITPLNGLENGFLAARIFTSETPGSGYNSEDWNLAYNQLFNSLAT